MTDAFIVVYLLFLWGWDYPRDHPLKRLVERFSFPFVYMGLWHGWSMFAPEPIHVCRWLKAVIVFDDGSVENWEPLRPAANQRILNTLFMRSFKYQHSLLGGRNRHLCLPLCRFLTAQASDAGRRVVRVELCREYRFVNPPDSPEVYSDTRSVTFFRFDADRARTGQDSLLRPAPVV